MDESARLARLGRPSDWIFAWALPTPEAARTAKAEAQAALATIGAAPGKQRPTEILYTSFRRQDLFMVLGDTAQRNAAESRLGRPKYRMQLT